MTSNFRLLLIPSLVGALVAVTLGIYANVHDNALIAVSVAGFSGPQEVKVWLASGAAFFALIQLFSALSMWGKLGSFSPSWMGGLHRWSGRIAFLFTIPVAVHCLYALGFSTLDARNITHSILGCLFFGVFTLKMLALPKKGLSGWVLPVIGGVVFTVLIGLWFTSSFWFFTTYGIKF